MKRLINSTTILSLALYVMPHNAQAQDFPKVTVDGTEVICLPTKKAECPEGAFCVVAKNDKNCEARATEALAAVAAGASPDAVAAEAPASDEAAAATAEADAAEKAAADAAAAEQAAADKAARKAARKAADEQAAAEAAAAVAAAQGAAEQAAAEAAAAAAEQAAATATEAPPAEEATVDAQTTEAQTTEAQTTEAQTTEAQTTEAQTLEATEAEATGEVEPVENVTEPAATVGEAMEFKTVTVGNQGFVCLPDAAAICPEGARCVVAKTKKRCEAKAEAMMADAADDTAEVVEVPAEDAAAVAAAQAAAEEAAAAAAADPDLQVIEAPVPTDEAVETLETALDTPTDPEEAVEAPEVEATQIEVVDGEVVDGEQGTLPSDLPPAEDAVVTTEVVTEEEARASTEEFDAAPTTVAPGKKTGLSDFEKVGLVALGALIVGAMINGNKQVVSNSGDRVVVRQPDGTYQVLKDDNALLREPGSTVRTETFADGSTRTIVQRTDGSQIVTIRDATGRVLQRVAYDKTGRGVVLINDLEPEERVDVSRLPHVDPSRNQISLEDENAALRARLAAAQAADLGRSFSLRQIRSIKEVRWLAPTVDVNNITFETGSSAIQASEARKLNRLGKLMVDMIEQNPGEVFLIEGHTDAVGSAASNLALSDRRAESVAKALTEYFGVPPENLVVQGYGEGELKIDTLGDERRNRRASVRIITELLGQNRL